MRVKYLLKAVNFLHIKGGIFGVGVVEKSADCLSLTQVMGMK